MTAAACHHSADERPDAAHVRAALAKAESRALELGHRWTHSRAKIYELMLNAGGPVKAYDLMELLRSDKPAKPPTVYRALEFLEDLGFVHRIASLNAYLACGDGDPEHAAAFLICNCCGSVREFEPGVVRTASNAALANGFKVQSVGLEVRGRCAHCV